MAVHERKVAHAVFEHLDAREDPPLRRLAYRGDVVHVDDAELARGDRFGVFDWREPEPTSTVPLEVMVPAALATGGAVSAADLAAAAAATDAATRAAAARADVLGTVTSGPVTPLERPVQSAAKGVWVEYAVSLGMPVEQAEAMKKTELIAATAATPPPADAPPAAPPADGESTVTPPADEQTTGQPAAGGDAGEGEGGADAPAPGQPLGRPARVATREIWEAYVVSRGTDPEAAAALTLDELKAVYPAETQED